MNILLDKGADTESAFNAGWTPLFKASSTGGSDIVCALIKKGANVNAVDCKGTSVRCHATRETYKILEAAGGKK